MACLEEEETELPTVLQLIADQHHLTYAQLAKALHLSVHEVVQLAQGSGQLTSQQLRVLGVLTHIDGRFWQRWQTTYFSD